MQGPLDSARHLHCLTPLQPIAADDVAQAVAAVIAGPPLQGTRSIAGPDVLTWTKSAGSPSLPAATTVTVTVDNTAGMFAAVTGDAIIAGQDAVIAPTGYRD